MRYGKKKKWIEDEDLRNKVIQKHDSLDAVIEDRKKNGYPIIKPDIPGSVKGGSDEKTDKEVALFQQGLNSVINGFEKVSRGYSDAIENRKEDIRDDIYPYKLMINSLATVADKMSAAHGILKGVSMSGYLLNPTLKALAESSSAQRAASVLGFGSDLTQFVTSDNPSDRNENAFQTAGDIMNYIGGTDILRRINIFGRYGDQLDALMDASGAGMSVYDGVIQPAVSGINNVVDMINKKEEGGEANSNEDQGKEYSPRLLDALSVLWGTGAIIPSMLIDRIYGSISGRPTDLNKALYSSIDPSGQRPDMSLSGVASLISNSVKLATKYIRGDFDKIDYLEEGKDVPLANKVAMAAWAKYNRLPYDKNLIIENPDGTYRLPREIEKSIRSDRDEIKKTYDTNLKLYNKKKEEYRNKINSSLGNGDDYNKELSDIEKDMSMYRAAVNMDAMNLNSMDSVLSGKPSVFNEFNFRGRDLRNILRGKAGNLNVLGDYTMRKDEDGRIVYNDTYDLNFPFDQILGGDIYKIKGFVREDGGVVGGGLSDKDEELFMKWYKSLSKHKGLNPDPDDKNQYYDYRAFWKENPELAERMLNNYPDAHFVDTYKLPGHPTFSNESKYGGRELGGEWVAGDDGRWYYKPSPYTSSYIDRTIDYLSGTGEGILYNGEYIMPDRIPYKMGDGGLIEKQDYIYNRLTSEYDIPPMQAAAIVANLTHESGLQTGALGDSGSSYGIQQWRDERRKNLYQFAKERGHVEPTMDDQIDYLMYEYNNGRAFQFSTRGQNLYQTGKSKNKTFDYYQFSKSDFDNAASLRDAVIAWNQGVGRPNKEFAMNDRKYKIAADIASRHGIKDGEKNYYNDMGYTPDGEMTGIHLPEVNIVANQSDQISTEEQKKTDYYNTYGRQIVSQMMSFNPESQSIPTSQDVSKESDKMDQDAVRISKAIAENKEAEKRKMLIEAFLPNIQLAVKGVTQVGK